MSISESLYFKEYQKYENQYVSVRNVILKLWKQNMHSYLSIDKVYKHISVNIF